MRFSGGFCGNGGGVCGVWGEGYVGGYSRGS